ncbi:M48 family metallopeptidase [Candidatus Brocadia sp. AMX2]|nr:M48 family metallopeptidase [Candidatus Brocadia sp. AMX2]
MPEFPMRLLLCPKAPALKTWLPLKVNPPLAMDLETIRVFAISKLSWIKKQQQKLLSQERETPREHLTRESHYYLGKRT